MFALRPSESAYVESILYDFQGGNDASYPTGGLLAGKDGVLYGNAGEGGSMRCHTAGCGAVFELEPSGSSYKEVVVYAFKGHRDGQTPGGTLADAQGRLYGTTGYGGYRDRGTVFRVRP